MYYQNNMKKKNIEALEKENKELREKIEWYRTKWEKTIKADIVHNDFLTEITDTISRSNDMIKKLRSDVNSFSEHNKIMINILKGYSLWDSFISKEIKRSGKTPPKEMPATLYLKQISAVDDHKKGKN